MTTIDELIQRYNAPPGGHETTSATHFVHFEWPEPDWTPDMSPESWRSFLEERENGDLATDKCTPLYSDLPYRDGAETLINLGHKALVVVNQERIGRGGLWHHITVVNTNPEVDGLVGFVDIEALQKLPGIPYSLPTTFKCQESLNRGVADICSFALPLWHTTTEPYYDKKTCEYLVNVVTEYGATGGEPGIKTRMEEQIPRGTAELLHWYNKKRGPTFIEELLGAFKFAEAKSWNLDLSDSNSRLKVLVSIPAKYFDAIPTEQAEFADLSSLRFITLVSSEVEKQIDELIGEMKKFHGNGKWKKAASQYIGPAPFYGNYNFLEEAKKVKFFLANLKRLLVLNDKNLRTQSDDIIEIGISEKYEVQYILLTDEEGSHDLRIGFNKLVSTDPFNYPRTVAYIFYLFEISNDIKKNKYIMGGWPTFLKKYTFPPPKQTPSSKKKNCRPSWKDPLKCMGPEFDEYRSRHLTDIKCDTLPERQQVQLGAAGAAYFQAIFTGETENFENQFAAFKTPASKLIEEVDIKKFKEQIEKENEFYDGSMDFVGDPFVEEIFNDLKEGDFKGGAEAIVKKVYEDVAYPFDVTKVIARVHQCLCAGMQRNIEEAMAAGVSDAEIIALRAAAAQAGCGNPCAVIPILCSCIPIPWPPRLEIPEFEIWDIMAFLVTLMIDAIINAIIQFLIDFIMGLLKQVLVCDRGSSRGRQQFIDAFNNAYPWEEDNAFSEDKIAEALRNNNIPPEFARPDLINQLIKDTVLILTPREFCELISGDAGVATLEAVSVLMEQKHPDLHATFSNLERIKVLFISIGALVDSSICRDLDQLLSSAPNEPAGYICEDTDLREDMAAGRATPEQIKQMLAEAAKCNADRLSSLVDVVQTLTGGGDLLASVIPNIFETPENPNGIIPRDPPSVAYVRETVSDSIFDSIEGRFYSEMNSNVPSLVTTTRGQPDENSVSTAMATLINRPPGYPAPDPRVAPPVRTEELRIAYSLCDDNPITTNWNRVRDSYTVQISDVATAPRPTILLDFDGQKTIDPTFLSLFDDLRGTATPSQEVFSNILASQWSSLPWNSSTISEKLRDPTTELAKFHRRTAFWDTTRDLVKQVCRTISQSKFLDSESRGFDRAFEALTSVEFTPHPSCSPRAPGILNLPDIRSQMTERYNKDMAPETHRYVNSVMWALIVIYMRVIIIDTALNGLFSFAQFKANDILKSDLLVSYFLNRMKTDLRKLDETFQFDVHNSAVPPGSNNFYDEVQSTISSIMADRKYVQEEQFVDPFTNEEVEVQLDPKWVEASLGGTIHDPSGILESLDVRAITESERAIVLLGEGRESVNRCGQSEDQPKGPYAVLTTDTDAMMEGERGHGHGPGWYYPIYLDQDSAMFADSLLDGEGIIHVHRFDDHPNKSFYMPNSYKNHGQDTRGMFQVYPPVEGSEADEIARFNEENPECQLDSESNSSSETSSGGTDANSGKKKIGYLELFLKEQFKAVAGELEVLLGTEINDIDNKMLGGFARLVDLPRWAPIGGDRFYRDKYGMNITLTREDIERQGNEELGRLYTLVETSTAQNLPVGEDTLGLIREELLRDPAIAQQIERDPTDFIKREFSYLRLGGFVTETYIKVTELSADDWEGIARVTPAAVRLIKDRDEHLKGLVSLQMWQEFLQTITQPSNNDELGLLVEREGVEVLEWGKYFSNLEMGLRLTYVYPTEHESGSESSGLVRNWILNNFMRREDMTYSPWSEDIESVIANKKAYLLKEKVYFDMTVESSDMPELNDLNLAEGDFVFDVYTVPVVSKELQVPPQLRWQRTGLNREPYTIPSTYTTLFLSKLKSEMRQDTTYRALFEYVFPLDRFLSLSTIYTVEHVSGLPGRPELFDGTKDLIRDLYYKMKVSTTEDWWKKSKPRGTQWWESPLDLSVPGILFMTPFKILEMLLTLVPPLDWFLGGLLSLLPDFPPHRSKKGDPCELE